MTEREQLAREPRIVALGRIAQEYEHDEPEGAFDRALNKAYDAGRASLREPSEPTQEEVDRVAAAICDCTRELTRYEDLDDHSLKFWRDHARAAIAAMRGEGK